MVMQTFVIICSNVLACECNTWPPLKSAFIHSLHPWETFQPVPFYKNVPLSYAQHKTSVPEYLKNNIPEMQAASSSF